MSKRPKILTLSDDERSALGDLKAAIDVANHIGLLDRLAEVVHPNIVNNFVDAVCQLLERGPKLGSFCHGKGDLVEVFLSSVEIDGRPSAEVVAGNTSVVWHYHELEQKEEAWHELVLLMLKMHEKKRRKR